MLLCLVKLPIHFELLSKNRRIPVYARPHLLRFPSLAHSQNWKMCILHIPIHLRTLAKNMGVYPKRPNLELAAPSVPFGAPSSSAILVFQQIFHGADLPARR